MNAIVVTMLDDGAFEVVGEKGAFRIMNNDDGNTKSWVVLDNNPDDDQWQILSDFVSLDSALNSAVSEASGEEKTEFDVLLPCGLTFKRPGIKTAEEVMASAGWYFVSELIGFIPTTTTMDRNAFEIRAELSKLITNDEFRLGDVVVSDEDEEGRHWITDVIMDYRGWLHLDDIQQVAEEEFRENGFNVTPFFDHRPRTNIASSEAVILAFPKGKVSCAA